MSISWVAGSVRARAMSGRRVGYQAARNLALSPNLESALAGLARTPYGHDVRLDQTLADAQHAVVDTLAWNLRVLAGWVPREGVTMLRVLAGALEAANVEEHLRHLAGAAPVPPPYRLGGLATAWPRLAATTSPDLLRAGLAASPWGDPGGVTRRQIGLAMRTALADRIMAAVPAAAGWAAADTALLVAREVFLQGRELSPRARIVASRILGPAALSATSLPALVAALPSGSRWVLADIEEPADLWLAEAHWWRRLERDGLALSRRAGAGPEAMVGAVAILAADAWRVRAALELAARGGTPVEVFDAVA